MMYTVLTILKIIGIVLLVVLAVLLALLILILFVPVRYEAKGHYRENKPVVTAKVSYLFPLLRLKFCYGEKKLAKITVFGIPVKDFLAPKRDKTLKKKKPSEKRKTLDKKKTPKKMRNKERIKTDKADRTDRIKEEQMKKVPQIEENAQTEFEARHKTETPAKAEMRMNQQACINAQETEKSLDIGERLQRLINKVKGLVAAVVQKCRDIWRRILDMRDNAQMRKEQIQHYIAVWKRDDVQKAVGIAKKTLVRVFRSIAPRRLRVNLHIGLGDPSGTGQLCGFYGMIYPFIGNYVILDPDFEQSVYEGSFYLKGKITVFTLVKAGCIFLFHKDLKCIRDFILHKEDLNE